MGTYKYKGNTKKFHTLNNNFQKTNKIYRIIDGYFGNIGKQGSKKIREIKCKDSLLEAKRLYDTMSNGGIEYKLPNGKGLKTNMKDGTIIVFREISSSGGPAVDINISQSNNNIKIKTQKIHFERNDNNEKH